MQPGVKSAVGALTLVFCLASPAWAQPSQIVWPRGVTFPASEKMEVLALARQMGIDDPVKVSMGVVAILGDRFVTVEGRITLNGHERRWRRASMFRYNWRGPDDAPPPELRTHRAGRWISMGESEQMVAWRIQDGDWFVDLTLQDVPYEDAERIVLAIRRQALVNRLPEPAVGNPASQRSLPMFDASLVYWIGKEGSSAGEYKVTYSGQDLSGYDLHVRIVGERVEVFALYAWVV